LPARATLQDNEEQEQGKQAWVHAISFPSARMVNGTANMLYDSTNWVPRYYSIVCNVTAGTRTALDSLSLIWKHSKSMSNLTSLSISGETVNITVSTTPPQPNAQIINLTIADSTVAEV
jgi:hypothetical protein